MESLEIIQEETTSGWWAVIHNGRTAYRSDALNGVMSWLRTSAFKDWGSVPIHIQPQEQVNTPMFTS